MRMTILSVAVVAGCAGASHSVVFKPTDPAFVPTAGPSPRVYLEDEDVEVSRAMLRSVGLIKVTVRGSSNDEKIVELAAEKGRALGCWLLVEHSAFEAMQSQLEGGATVILAHGAAPHATPVPKPHDRSTVFDCVVRASAPTARYQVTLACMPSCCCR